MMSEGHAANNMCKICSKSTEPIVCSKGTFYHCKSCDFIFLEDNKLLSQEKEKERYLLHNNTEENQGYLDMLNDFIEKTILPYKIKSILDFGSGPNPVLAGILKKKRFQVDIYDLYFHPDDSYKTKKYDAIILTEVLEHLENPLRVLKELKNLLNKNGIIAIMTLFHPNNTDLFKNWWYITDLTHISFFTPKTLEIIGKKLNLRFRLIDDKNTCILIKGNITA